MALLTRPDLLRSDATEFRTKLASARAALLKEARTTPFSATFDIFLSHSSMHPQEVRVIKARFERAGYSVYVDWVEDEDLDRSDVSPATAMRLRHRIESSRSLLVHATEGAKISRWVPWELGVADGLDKRTAILPVLADKRSTDTYRGSEYLGLYPYVHFARAVGSRTVMPWVNRNARTYVRFQSWLKGEEPRLRHPLVE